MDKRVYMLKDMVVFKPVLPILKLIRRKCWQMRGRVRLLKIKKTDIWLELGSGGKPGSGNWVTVDMNGQCDIYHDLSRGIPFKDNSVSRIYSSHFFEHLTPEQAACCMKECLRVLKPGGEFSIAVPNARYYIDAYINKTSGFRGMKLNNWIDYARFVAYCGGSHKNMFDQESLCNFLSYSGLMNVVSREFDPSTDLEIRRDETIYAKGDKGLP